MEKPEINCPNCGLKMISRGYNRKRDAKEYRCKECKSCRTIPIEMVEPDEEIVAESVKLAKQKQKLQDRQRIERKSFREHARQENALEELLKEIKEHIKKVKIPKTKSHKPNKGASAIAHLTDLHLNELIRILGNTYDFRVASQRLFAYARDVQMYLEANGITELVVLFTGDLLNSDRRLDEKMACATNRAKASVLAAKLLSQLILDLNQFANISVISITGNESRIGDEITSIDELATDNFDFLIYEMMKLMLDGKDGIIFVSGDQFEYAFRVMDSNILACHGHNFKSMNDKEISAFMDKWGKKGFPLDFVACGHIHSTLIADYLLRSASLPGNNAYADVKLNLCGRASQNLYLVYPNKKLNAIRLDLQNIAEDSPMYEIDPDLEAYNAKSVSKIKQQTEIFKIVV